MISALADLIIFIAATSGGMRVANAHLVSFGIAAILNYFLKVRGAAVAAGRGSDLRLHVHLLVVSLFAAFVRGAVLGLLTNVWGWPAQVSIVFAIIATMAITSPGYREPEDFLLTRR